MIARLMGLKTISPGDLHQLIQEQRVTVIDVNSRQSWITARVMCRKAPNAARRAKKMGYTNVRVLSAGISGWLADSLPTESGA
jgi:hypothetical protein